MSDEPWLPFPIKVDENIPEGWVFLDRGDGTLVPVCAVMPDDDQEAAQSARRSETPEPG